MIVIPPLSPDLASTVLQKVAVAIKRRCRRGARALEDALIEARAAVIGAEGADQESSWEKALDVTLYCPEDWDGRLTYSWA